MKLINSILTTSVLFGLCLMALNSNLAYGNYPVFNTQDFTFDDQEMRTWTSGKHKVRAKLVELKGDKIVLLKTDGKRRTVLLDVLSKRDQDLVASLVKKIQEDKEIWGIPDEDEAANEMIDEMKKEMRENGFGDMADKFENEIQKQIQDAEKRHADRKQGRNNRSFNNRPFNSSNKNRSFGQRTPNTRKPKDSSPRKQQNSLPSNLPSVSNANTITNHQFGFSVTIPSRFHEWNHAPFHIPDKLYLFEDSTTDNWNSSDLVIIRRLRSKLDKLSMQIPPSMRNGANQTTETYTHWNGNRIKVFRTVEHTDEGDYLSFIVPFDLPQEAIQLIVGGPPEDEFRIKQTMQDIVNSFKQLNTGGVIAGTNSKAQFSTNKSKDSSGLVALFSSPERVRLLSIGMGRLAGFVLICILLVTSIRGMFTKKKKRKRRF